MHKVSIALSCVLFLCQSVATETDRPLLVNTRYGSLEGKWMTSRSGRQFKAFLGVPFATPPIGNLRFMPPTLPKKWEGVRDATVEGNVCVQRFRNGSEDCLYLNIFTHDTTNNKNSPVMVYIHGGGYYLGSSSLKTAGPEYLMDRDIVLVSIQYRLGIFGFLSTEDVVIPGNMGLKDQARALQWVQDNIERFGGDRSKVTIFGFSAGSSSVHYHMMSPVSKDLFARAISQSGVAQSTFASIGKNILRNVTLNLAQSLNCDSTVSEVILLCLQNKTTTEVQQEYSKLQDEKNTFNRVIFRPIVEEPTDHAFITTSPLNSTTDKPWLVGVNQNEGLFKINMTSLNETMSVIKLNFSQIWPANKISEDTSPQAANISEMIYNYYFKNAFSVNESIEALEHLLTDTWFVWPTLQAIRNHQGTLYCYLFQHEGQHSISEVLAGHRGFGVSHADELQYLFSLKEVFSDILNEEDVNISKLLVNLWVNFAEGSNPTPSPVSSNPQLQSDDKVFWEASTDNTDPNFFIIQSEKLSMKKNIFFDRISFLNHLFLNNSNTA